MKKDRIERDEFTIVRKSQNCKKTLRIAKFKLTTARKSTISKKKKSESRDLNKTGFHTNQS